MSETLEEGRFAMACAKALLEGKPPPSAGRRASLIPATDPRPRTSSGRRPAGPRARFRRVPPTCIRIKEGFAPHGRQVTVGGRPTDYWNAPRHYGPMMGGYFNGFGGGACCRDC